MTESSTISLNDIVTFIINGVSIYKFFKSKTRIFKEHVVNKLFYKSNNPTINIINNTYITNNIIQPQIRSNKTYKEVE